MEARETRAGEERTARRAGGREDQRTLKEVGRGRQERGGGRNQACNPSTCEAEAGGLLQFQDQPGLPSETMRDSGDGAQVAVLA